MSAQNDCLYENTGQGMRLRFTSLGLRLVREWFSGLEMRLGFTGLGMRLRLITYTAVIHD